MGLMKAVDSDNNEVFVRADADGKLVLSGGGGGTSSEVEVTNFPSTNISTFTATIPNAGTESGNFLLPPGHALVGLYGPSDWTAADLNVQVSENGTDFFPVHDASGDPVVITMGADRYVRLNPSDWVGLQYVRFVSGVTQAASRDIIVKTRLV